MSMKNSNSKCVINQFGRMTLALMLLTSSIVANAIPITFAFSGEVSWNYVDVPVGTILSGSITYDPTTPLVEVEPYHYGYLIDSFVLNINGESATHSGGSIRIDGSNVGITAGPYNYAGGGTPFSNAVSGITVAGIGLSLSGLGVPGVLPDAPAAFYGLTGSFGINRSGGDVYDIDSLANLSLPPSVTHNVPEPSILWLLGIGVLFLWFKHRLCYVSGKLRVLA